MGSGINGKKKGDAAEVDKNSVGADDLECDTLCVCVCLH